MIVEKRTYVTYPGKAAEYFALYENEGMAVQTRVLGRLVGYYQTEIGDVNTIVHLWAYNDLAERDERRKQLSTEPAWQAYLQKSRPLIVSQESCILKPAPFFTPTWQEPK